MTTDTPKPPKSLPKPQHPLWLSVVTDYDLSPAELRVLEDALRLCARADDAAAIVDAEGVTCSDRYGSPKAHPAVDVETRCRSTAARLFAQLGVKLVDDSNESFVTRRARRAANARWARA